ncbi:Holliday junction branch migration protein RuvA [Helcococcus kunzii]|uniref:Holliday junction branch migration protein RuvA n=1 Tax=Helcococcus kunzii TaxID=40091 RepID=UPI001BAF8CF3|nr:Holliday junction branch migration protein RuvA [Helcococcus kunzii]MCT1795498.1 Holliday junction branch migration protein RuvA [Helcococcus kunzii]MCT1989178.1 Holliday junction branch migration protein RuvA [Helcococcus kunzii]QUY64744.1 Holliday junction branch migration protein RuvA [Helcococcus kunzii]
MFSYIIGELKIIKEEFIVIENNNIGYKIYMPQNSISKLIKNEVYKIFTEFIVREDAVLLYGFLDDDELEMFLSLKQVSGIGPKAALSILSTLTVQEIKLAIIGNEVKELSRAPGVGKKTASRIILELTDKIDIDSIVSPDNDFEVDNTKNEDYDIAVDALMNLGYTRQDAVNALKEVDFSNLSLSEIIKQALKRI